MVCAVNTKLVLAAARHSPYRNGMNKPRNRLKELREAAKLSQGDLATRIASQQPQVVRWEKQPHEPKYRQIPMAKAIKVAEVLDVPLWKIRPDILSKDSVDPLMEGLSEGEKKDVRDYIRFKHEQRRSSP